MNIYPYNRISAINYSHIWAFDKNPNYYDFEDLGGDCTNFISQCVYEGCNIMNYMPLYGWYYTSLNDRTPSWTGVEFFYNFITKNESYGPFGVEVDISNVLPGDIVQICFPNNNKFTHSVIIVEIKNSLFSISYNDILITTHSIDRDYYPLSNYTFSNVRFLHINGYRN